MIADFHHAAGQDTTNPAVHRVLHGLCREGADIGQHTWLPTTLTLRAPTGGSVVLAAITLKLGAYGFLRFILPIVPDASHMLAPFVVAISLIAIVYIGFVALVQTDMKKLVAYSSISHMGVRDARLLPVCGRAGQCPRD